MSQSQKEPTKKEISELYFGVSAIDKAANRYKCQCGTFRTCDTKLYGYANFSSHIYTQHPDYLYRDFKDSVPLATGDELSSSQSTQASEKHTLYDFFDKKANNIFRWIEWVVDDVHSLNFVEKPLT